MEGKEKIGIIGSGLVGRSWAMIFAATGTYEVSLFDINPKQITSALADIKNQLETVEKSGMLRGTDGPAKQFGRIIGTSSISECVKGCKYIQECTPEDLELKKRVFKELDAHVDSETIIASSSSCIVPSQFTEQLSHRENCLVAHPVNPPYYVKYVEIVPSPWTKTSVVQDTRKIMEEIGQSPVTLTTEHPGFALNRIQYVILNECFHLVNDGILSVEDVDKVMKEGLAPRYTWMGPLETIHLNAEGASNYFEQYGTGLCSVSSTMKPTPDWTNEALTNPIAQQLNKMVPLEELQKRRAWRDTKLIASAKMKKELLNKQD